MIQAENTTILDKQILDLFNYCKTISKKLRPEIIFENRFKSICLCYCQYKAINFSEFLESKQNSLSDYIKQLRDLEDMEHENKSYLDWLNKNKKGYKI